MDIDVRTVHFTSRDQSLVLVGSNLAAAGRCILIAMGPDTGLGGRV